MHATSRLLAALALAAFALPLAPSGAAAQITFSQASAFGGTYQFGLTQSPIATSGSERLFEFRLQQVLPGGTVLPTPSEVFVQFTTGQTRTFAGLTTSGNAIIGTALLPWDDRVESATITFQRPGDPSATVTAFNVQTVPEPATVALMATGLLGVGIVARRRAGRA